MTLKLIGLAGPAGCGKDTVAQILCDTQEFRRISLADPIREGIMAMLEIPWECQSCKRLEPNGEETALICSSSDSI